MGVLVIFISILSVFLFVVLLVCSVLGVLAYVCCLNLRRNVSMLVSYFRVTDGQLTPKDVCYGDVP